jgi:hypothetical protein
MADAKSSHGMIAVDKMGTKVLFLNPVTYETEVVLEDFPRTVHELSVDRWETLRGAVENCRRALTGEMALHVIGLDERLV